VQAEIAEDYGVSQPTISRAISAITPLLVKALSGFVPVADELGDGTYYVVDGTLLPCWTWRAHPELKSGKYRATGLKVLLACTLSGRLAWISDPSTGNHHDMYSLKESGLLDGVDPALFSGDTGFIGSGMITLSGNRSTGSSSPGRRNSTRMSPGSGGLSSRSSQTSRPGG
jgi:hypothetical protein